MFFDKIRTFCKIVEGGGNFASAANVLNLSRSGVSKQIHSLEQELGFRLFQGLKGKHDLTPEGKVFYPTAQKILAEYSSVLTRMNDVASQIGGSLKIGTTSFLASQYMVDYIKELLHTHPTLNLEIIGNDAFREHLPNDIDIVIWPGKLRSNSSVVHLHLMNDQLGLYASEDYIKKHGLPQTRGELKGHRLISYGEDSFKPYKEINWHLDLEEERLKPFFAINSENGIRKAIEQGLGIGSLSRLEVSTSHHHLIEVIPEVDKPQLELYFVLAAGREKTERMIAIYDYFKHIFLNHQLYLAA